MPNLVLFQSARRGALLASICLTAALSFGLAAEKETASSVVFRNVSDEVGTANPGFGWHSYHDAITGADWDNDGDVDILVVVSPHDSGPHKGCARLFVNRFAESGRLYFEDRTETLMPDGIHQHCTADSCPFFMDLDADGDLDLASISDEARPTTFRNNGKGIFSLERWGFSAQYCTVKDLDGDGDLDVIGEDTGRTYLNDGTGRFTETRTALALSGHMPRDKVLPTPEGITVDEEVKTKAATPGHVYFYWKQCDLNGDGIPDYHLSLSEAYGFKLNRFYVGTKAGAYRDVTMETGLPSVGEIRFVRLDPRQPLGACVTHNGPEAGFYLGDGKGHFRKAPPSDADLVLRDTTGGCYTAPQGFPDLNNDGILDLVTYHYRAGRGSAIFQGLGEGRFQLVQRLGSGSGQFIADLDNDGRMDVVGSGAPGLQIWQNVSTSGSWLRVILRGSGKNPFAANAEVVAYPAGALGDEKKAIARFGPTHTAGLPVHLGLGRHQKVDLKVLFADGKVVTRKGVAANQTVRIRQ